MEKNELERNAIAAKLKFELRSDQRAADQSKLDSRMAAAKMNRCMTLLKTELAEEKRMMDKTDHASLFNKQVQREIELAKAIEVEKHNESAAQSRSLFLRQQSEELRDLLKKLKKGYLCRDLKNQVANNEHRRQQDKLENLQSERLASAALYNEAEFEAKEEREKWARILQYKAFILDQVKRAQDAANVGNMNRIEYERKEMEKLLKALEEEAETEKRDSRERKQKLLKEYMYWMKLRQDELQSQEKNMVAREKMIDEQRKAIDARQSTEKEERLRLQRLRDENNMKIAAGIKAQKDMIEERSNMIFDLRAQEYMEKLFQDDIAEKTKLERSKRETYNALMTQMKEREIEKEMQKKEESKIKDILNEDLAKQDAKENEKLRLKKEAKRKYAAELREQMREHEMKKEAEKEDHHARYAHVQATHKAWDDEIKQERERVIREHVPLVIGCLNRASLKMDDVPILKDLAKHHESMKDFNFENLDKVRPWEQYSKCNKKCLRLREM